MLSNVRELGEQSRNTAHRRADEERGEEHGANRVHALEELLHVKFGGVCCRAAVLFDRSMRVELIVFVVAELLNLSEHK